MVRCNIYYYTGLQLFQSNHYRLRIDYSTRWTSTGDFAISYFAKNVDSWLQTNRRKVSPNLHTAF